MIATNYHEMLTRQRAELDPDLRAELEKHPPEQQLTDPYVQIQVCRHLSAIRRTLEALASATHQQNTQGSQ